MVAAPLPKAKLKRAPRGVLARKDTEDGPLEIIWPEDSLWYKAYVRNFLMLEPKSFMAKKFRERFRLPYPNFLQLVASVSESELFDRWCGYKPNNKQSLPIELLVARLSKNLNPRNYDSSGMGPGNDLVGEV